MKKILYLMVITFLIFIVLSSCSQTNKIEQDAIPKPGFSVSKTNYTFEQVIGHSNCMVVAELITFNDKDDYYIENMFKVTEVLYGNSEETILLNMDKNDVFIADNNYVIGEEYFLILERFDSVFYNSPLYVMSANLHIPIKNINQSTINGEYLDKEFLSNDREKAIQYILNTKKESLIKEDNQDLFYTTSMNMQEIVEVSLQIFKIQVTDTLENPAAVNNYNGLNYSCLLLNVYKGKVNKGDNNGLWVISFKDSMKIGEEYIILSSLNDEESLIYWPNSKNSVISVKDEKAIQELREITGLELN
ncbi:MAG: hypothetical protein FWG44_03895 [Oscillospiraceae bacterium]|nr:hypothetical protein [Oscillospiraceae bacterium]